MRSLHHLRSSALLLVAAALASGCGPDIQRLSFSGTTTSFSRAGRTHDSLPEVQPGTAFSGYIEFDASTRDASPDPVIGAYAQAITAYHLTIDGREFPLDIKGATVNVFGVQNDADVDRRGAKRDLLQPDLAGASLAGQTGAAAVGWMSQLNLASTAPGTLTTDALPRALPPLAAFDRDRAVKLEGANPEGTDTWSWEGVITEASIAPTPDARR